MESKYPVYHIKEGEDWSGQAKKWDGNKHTRLYVALFQNPNPPVMPGGEDNYEWSFYIAPEVEVILDDRETRWIYGLRLGAVFDKKNLEWKLLEAPIQMRHTKNLYVRVLIGIIRDQDRLMAALRSAFVLRPRKDKSWNCISCMQDGLRRLQETQERQNIFSDVVLDWQTIRTAAMWYVERKTSEGRFAEGVKSTDDIPPTWDLLGNPQCETAA